MRGKFYVDKASLISFFTSPTDEQKAEFARHLKCSDVDVDEVAKEILEEFSDTLEVVVVAGEFFPTNLELAVAMLKFVNNSPHLMQIYLLVDMLEYYTFQVFHLAIEYDSLEEMDSIWQLAQDNDIKEEMLGACDYLACELAAESLDKTRYILEKAQGMETEDDVLIKAFYHAYENIGIQQHILRRAAQIEGLQRKIVAYEEYCVFESQDVHLHRVIFSNFNAREQAEICDILQTKGYLLEPPDQLISEAGQLALLNSAGHDITTPSCTQDLGQCFGRTNLQQDQSLRVSTSMPVQSVVGIQLSNLPQLGNNFANQIKKTENGKIGR